MGCMRRLGCLIVLAALAAAGWFTRDRWRPLVWHGDGAHAAAPAPAALPWDLVTPQGAITAKTAILKLAQRSGPVFANVSGAEFTAYVVDELSRQLPPSAQGTTATVIGDALYIRTMVRPADFGVDRALGPLAKVLGEREPMELGGSIDVVRPGLGSFSVHSLKFRDISVPGPAIPSVLDRMVTGARPAQIASNALPLVLPVQIGDVRVRNGRITLYKAGQ